MKQADCWYWCDIDTHSLVILQQARLQWPQLQPLMTNEATLHNYANLRTHETRQATATGCPD